MSTHEKRLNSVPVFSLVGALACVIAGIISFGGQVFQANTPFFAFVSFGIIGAILFALFRIKRYRDAVFAAVLLFLLAYLFSGRAFMLTQVLFSLMVFLSVLLYERYFYHQLNRLFYARPLILAGLFSIGFLLATLMMAVIYSAPSNQFFPFRNLPVGFLIGLGLGTGFELADYFVSRGITIPKTGS